MIPNISFLASAVVGPLDASLRSDDSSYTASHPAALSNGDEADPPLLLPGWSALLAEPILIELGARPVYRPEYALAGVVTNSVLEYGFGPESSLYRRHFPTGHVRPAAATTVVCRRLTRSAPDADIRAALAPHRLVGEEDFLRALKCVPRDRWYIAFARSVTEPGQVLTLHARWIFGGIAIAACPIDRASLWGRDTIVIAPQA